MTAPGERDLAAEETHAEWLGWAEANGYRNELAAYGYDDVRDAFTAGMQAERDLAAAQPPESTTAERDSYRDVLRLLASADPLTPAFARWGDQAAPSELAERVRVARRALDDYAPPADGKPAPQPAPAGPGCTVCAQVGGPHGVPQPAPGTGR